VGRFRNPTASFERITEIPTACIQEDTKKVMSRIFTFMSRINQQLSHLDRYSENCVITTDVSDVFGSDPVPDERAIAKGTIFGCTSFYN